MSHSDNLESLIGRDLAASVLSEISGFATHSDKAYDGHIAKDKTQDIVYNLRHNKDLLERVVSGDVTPQDLVYMRPWELDYSKWRTIDERRQYIEAKKQNMATTDAYKCKRCGKRKATTFELQTRAADEPSTVFVKCVECGYVSKYN